MPWPSAPHVLVIDDDRPILDLYRDLLEDEGYRVTGRAYPDVEPAEAAALRPDAIILDFVFGGENVGLGFLERLKADPATEPIPVVVCTGDRRAAEDARAELDGWGCGVVLKPFDVDELAAKVRACVKIATAA